MTRAARAAGRLELGRDAILAFRRRVGGLDARVGLTEAALRDAAQAGLQDSAPRAALLSLHARLHDVQPETWEHRALVQVWGPRFAVHVVAACDVAPFTVGRLAHDRRAAERAAAWLGRLRRVLASGEAGGAPADPEDELTVAVRYAGSTGAVLLRWDGARAPGLRLVDPPDVDPVDAQRELARRHLHVLGPATEAAFAVWAGISRRAAARTYASLADELVPVRTPLGDAWLLARDEDAVRAPEGGPAPARLLPSGDPWWLRWGDERELLVPDAGRRERLWTPRVWPGALLVDGELRGTWRRAGRTVRVEPWERLGRGAREAVEAEARGLPLPAGPGEIAVEWE